eukprot:15434836-Alexandrium_andersonii.AAC.1
MGRAEAHYRQIVPCHGAGSCLAWAAAQEANRQSSAPRLGRLGMRGGRHDGRSPGKSSSLPISLGWTPQHHARPCHPLALDLPRPAIKGHQ